MSGKYPAANDRSTPPRARPADRPGQWGVTHGQADDHGGLVQDGRTVRCGPVGRLVYSEGGEKVGDQIETGISITLLDPFERGGAEQAPKPIGRSVAEAERKGESMEGEGARPCAQVQRLGVGRRDREASSLSDSRPARRWRAPRPS